MKSKGIEILSNVFLNFILIRIRLWKKQCSRFNLIRLDFQVYLEDCLDREPDSFGIVQLILAPKTKIKELTKKLTSQIEQKTDVNLQNQVVRFIETVIVYKFLQLSRPEIEDMFTLSDLKETRVYKDAKQEGKLEGWQLGEVKGQASARTYAS